ncbi:MAG TPA: hypothetical protein VF077_12645 [Nitrospiraceae bacterium]
MPSYTVQGKHIYRASTVETRMGTKPDGSPDIVRQPGPMERVEVGTVLDDVSDAELRAFPDRFAPVQAEAEAPEQAGDTTVATITARGAAHSTEPGPVPPGTTVEQAAASRAAQQRPATATAADQATASAETTTPSGEAPHGSARHARRGASD